MINLFSARLTRHLTQEDRIPLILAVLFFLYAGALSVIYYKEKVIVDDPSTMFFMMTAHGDHFIYHYRYGGWLIFLLPMIGVWLQLPLKVVAILYSVGHIVPGFLLFLVSHFVLRKEYPYLSLLPLSPYFLCYDSFYSIVDNFTAISLIGFGLSMWIKAHKEHSGSQKSWIYYGIGGSSMVFSTTLVHVYGFSVVLYASFLISLLFLSERRKIKGDFLIVSVATLLLSLSKYLFLSLYEKSVSEEISDNFQKALHSLSDSGFLKYIYLHHSTLFLYEFYIAIIVVLYILIFRKRSRLLIYFTVIAALAQLLYLSISLYERGWRIYADYYAIPIYFILFSGIIVTLSTGQRSYMDKYVLPAFTSLILLLSCLGYSLPKQSSK